MKDSTLIAAQVSSQITNRVEKLAGISQLSVDPVLGRKWRGRDGQEFDCATWLHKARSLTKDQFRTDWAGNGTVGDYLFLVCQLYYCPN